MVLVNHPSIKNRKEGGGFVQAGSIFSAQCFLCLWVGKWYQFSWSTVRELNWQCRQCRPAGRASKQSIYLDVYDRNAHSTHQKHFGPATTITTWYRVVLNHFEMKTVLRHFVIPQPTYIVVNQHFVP